MFSRSAPPEPTPEPAPAPPASREMRDAKVFQPSTMASPRAERLARGEDRRARRLVGMGTTPVRLAPTGRDALPRIVEVEAFVDIDRPMNVYVRHVGDDHLEPVVRHVGDPQKVVKLPGAIPRRPRDWTPTRGHAAPDTRVALD